MNSLQIRREFIKYAMLGTLGMIGLSCYILADTFFIANGVGADGLTALNFAIPIFSFMQGVGLMIGMGGATRFSISKSGTVFTHAFIFAVFASVLFLAAGLFFSRPLAAWLGADTQLLTLTAVYLKTFLCFAPMFMLNNLVICFVRNDGCPRLAMTAMLTGSFSNIVLDYILVFPCSLGMFGAALATGLAPVISLIILSSHFLRHKNTFGLCRLRPQLKPLGDIAALGMSSLINEVSSGIVVIVFNALILRISGNLGIAAYGIVVNIALVIISIFTGISQGIQPLISRLYGDGALAGTRRVLLYGILTAVGIALVIYGVTFLFTEPIVSAFNRDNNSILAQLAVSGVHIYFTAFAPMGVNILSATYFSAIDQPRNAFVLSILRGLLLIIPMAVLMSRLFGMTGIWLTITVTESLVLILSAVLLLRVRHTVK
jgi:Na+-driven multidrug efflux pump